MWTGDYWQFVAGAALESKSGEWKPNVLAFLAEPNS